MRILISTELRYTAISLKLAAELEINPDELFRIIEDIESKMSNKWFDFFSSKPQDDPELPPTDRIEKPLKLSHIGVSELQKISNGFKPLKATGTTLFDVLKILAQAASAAGMTEAHSHLMAKAEDTKKADQIMKTTNAILDDPKSTEMQKAHMLKMAVRSYEEEAKRIIQSVKSGMLAFVHAN